VTLNPSQFALPGMEHLAHPLAPYVAAGARFAFHTQPGQGYNERAYPYRPPASFNTPVYEHSLTAHHGQQDVGDMWWRGNKPPDRSHNYPGEITWVGRPDPKTEDVYRDNDAGVWRAKNQPPAHKGVMSAMFEFAHEHPLPGQTTVPVHSPDRTPEGERWAQQTGYGHLTPELGDFDWKPPAGTHPYERAGSPPQLAPAMEGQRVLFGPATGRKFYDPHAGPRPRPTGRALQLQRGRRRISS